MQLGELQAHRDQVEDHGAALWVISPDTPERLRGLWEEKALSFPSLLDPEAEVTRAYGLLNEDRPPLPHPATIVIGKDGKVAWLEVDEDYRIRPATETVLKALGSLGDGEGGEETTGEQ